MAKRAMPARHGIHQGHAMPLPVLPRRMNCDEGPVQLDPPGITLIDPFAPPV